MDLKTIIRTSAIIYADETSSVSTKTIQRKFIEAVFIDNENNPLSINNLLTEIEKKFNLSFLADETQAIINKADINHFEIRLDSTTIENTIISLSESRYRYLKNKEVTNNFEKFTKDFAENHAQCECTDDEIKESLYKFLYELLNTNIQLYSNILKPQNAQNTFTIDSSKFKDVEIRIINDFLSWNNPEKNKALFKIVSYCIEYALVANHSSGDSTYLASLRNKHFYLDNNIIYRALGINGDTRKARTTVFLYKCIESGQNIYISKYTKKEFLDTVDYHINQLKRLPFGRINPNLFSKYCISPSFYEYYHNWRNGRLTYGFDSFQAYIIGEYEGLLKRFKIEEDYKIPYDENNSIVKNKIDDLKSEIQSVKSNGYEESHKFDAQNYYLIEIKRGENNRNIQDTKHYLITTDQKLKTWDDNRSQGQSVTMLPSHWMGLLLKYISRTDDDFKSFVSFLRLNQHEDLIDENNLQIILSGISEITEDFRRQDTVMERMMERKFSGIIDTKNPQNTRLEAKKFAKETLENELENTKTAHKETLKSAESKHEEELKTIANKFENEKDNITSKNREHIERLFENERIIKQREKYDAVCAEIKKIKRLKTNAEERAEDDFKKEKFKFLSIPITLGLILFICVLIFDWNVMEKITWIVSALIIGLTYVYMGLYGKSFNPVEFFDVLKTKITNRVYREFTVDLSEISELEELEKELKEKITTP